MNEELELPSPESLGSVLREWRQVNELRLEDVGLVADVSRQTVANWEMDLTGSVPDILQVLRLERRWPGLLTAIGVCGKARR